MITALYDWVHFERWTKTRTSEILLGLFAGKLFIGKRPGFQKVVSIRKVSSCKEKQGYDTNNAG